jgi:prevent-host-death family protein
MRTVGVRELKSNLSKYLKRVEAGERLTVTDRGRAIAALVPAERAPTVDWAHALVASGRAMWTGGKPVGLRSRVRSRGKPTSRMVIEDRR